MSVDNIVDLEASAVAVYPICGYHNVSLEQVDYGGLFQDKDPDTEEPFWWIDLSGFGCQTPISEDLSDEDYEAEVNKCNESWYMKLEVEVRQ